MARARKKTAKHPGFKAVQSKIARQQVAKGVSADEAKERAGAILASSTRKASAKAKKKNPFLKRVAPKRKR